MVETFRYDNNQLDLHEQILEPDHCLIHTINGFICHSKVSIDNPELVGKPIRFSKVAAQAVAKRLTDEDGVPNVKIVPLDEFATFQCGGSQCRGCNKTTTRGTKSTRKTSVPKRPHS